MQTMCPNCRGKGKIKEEWIGKRIKCPNCSEMFVVQPLENKAGSAPKTPVRKKVPQPAPTAPPSAKVTTACSQCGTPTSENELIDFNGTLVCGQCKNLYLQKMREGVAAVDVDFEYGGFWRRFLAKIIDGLISGLVLLVFALGFGFLIGVAGDNEALIALSNNLWSFVVGVTYSTWFVGKYGATPGKMALGLKIVKADGANLTYKQAFYRYLAELVSYFVLCIGYIMVAFDEEKRGLHDRICDTRVIRTS